MTGRSSIGISGGKATGATSQAVQGYVCVDLRVEFRFRTQQYSQSVAIDDEDVLLDLAAQAIGAAQVLRERKRRRVGKETVVVTGSEVAAAQAIVRRSAEKGKKVSPAVTKIAHAKGKGKK